MWCRCGYCFYSADIRKRVHQSYLIVCDTDWRKFLKSELAYLECTDQESKLAAISRSSKYTGHAKICPSCECLRLVLPKNDYVFYYQYEETNISLEQCQCGYHFNELVSVRKREYESYTIICDKNYRKFLKADLAILKDTAHSLKPDMAVCSSKYVRAARRCPICKRFLFALARKSNVACYQLDEIGEWVGGKLTLSSVR